MKGKILFTGLLVLAIALGGCVKATECKKEGEAIPVVAEPPKCCAGLTLIPPESQSITAIRGYCTAKCGDSICNEIESKYNCPTDCIDNGQFVERELDFETISQGYAASFETKQNSVIADRQGLTDLWSQLFGSSPPQPLPNIDFSNEMAIVVFLNAQPLGSYRVEVTKIIEKSDKVEVFYIKSTSQLSSPDSTSPTGVLPMKLPYHVVKVERIDKEVEFQRVLPTGEMILSSDKNSYLAGEELVITLLNNTDQNYLRDARFCGLVIEKFEVETWSHVLGVPCAGVPVYDVLLPGEEASYTFELTENFNGTYRASYIGLHSNEFEFS